jgi:hypothetical protein
MLSERDYCRRRVDDAAQATEPFMKSAYEKVAEYWMLLARLDSVLGNEKTTKTPRKPGP